VSALDGKTIRCVEEDATSPVDGRDDESRLVIYCTDGTAIEIKGGGDDCDEWVSFAELTDDDLAERAYAKVERERAEDDRAHKRAAWLALSCEDRAIERERKQRESPPSAIHNAMMHYFASMYKRSAPLYPEPEHTVRDPCEHCGERECPNATERVIPASPGIMGMGFEVRCEAGSMRTKARRS
jgi:hypothetical protein